MKKVLKSKYHKQGYIEMALPAVGGQSGFKKFKIEQIDVNEIWASVEQAIQHRDRDFYYPIMEDIKKNGMEFPIMVIKGTRADIIKQKKIWGDRILPLPFWCHEDTSLPFITCWGGSQRLRIARELGYTHIDCAIMDEFEQAHRLQRTMRLPYADKYYGGEA